MENDKRRALEMWALIIPILLAAGAAKMIANAARMKVFPSSALPSPQELDSLRGFVVRRSEPALSRSPTPGVVYAGSDPLSSQGRATVSNYVVQENLSAAQSRPARWIVSTIMITDSRRVAVVDGALVSAGSALPGGARVISVEPDHVVIEDAHGLRRDLPVQGGAN
jgi:hypothetical protein